MKKNILKIFFIGAVFFFHSASASAATYFVATNGNNNNNGTSTSTPFQTIQKSLAMVHAGDTVNILAGTYNESLKLVTSGTSSAPITVQSYNGDSVTINSGTARAIYLGAKNGAINYYTFRGLTFVSTYQSSYSGSDVNTGYNFSIDFSSGSWWGTGAPVDNVQATDGNNGFVMENCDITGAIALMGNHNTITGCTINGNGQWMDGIFDTTIVGNHNSVTHNTIYGFTNRAYHSMTNTSYNDISYNIVHDCGNGGNGGSIDFDGEYLPCDYCSANYNIIYNCNWAGDSGIQFENGTNGTAIGNTIYNCTNGIIAINYGPSSGTGPYGEFRDIDTNILIANNVIANASSSGIALIQTSGNFIYNNSIYHSGSGYAIDLTTGGISSDYSSGGNVIENNIISNSSNGIQVLTVSGTAANTIRYNLFYGNTSNGITGTNVITGNPNFINTALNPPNLNIAAGSAAIDAGTNIGVITTDLNGAPRGSTYDIGAYEYSNGANVTPPAAPSGLNVQ